MTCAVDVTDSEETLGARVVDGAADAVDRRAGPVAVDVDEDGRAVDRTPTKRVVLRGSTRAARRRRRTVQAEREAERRAQRSAGGDTDEELDDMPDPSPPPE